MADADSACAMAAVTPAEEPIAAASTSRSPLPGGNGSGRPTTVDVATSETSWRTTPRSDSSTRRRALRTKVRDRSAHPRSSNFLGRGTCNRDHGSRGRLVQGLHFIVV
ncbi:unnamed protein product [Lampetra planeri]